MTCGPSICAGRRAARASIGNQHEPEQVPDNPADTAGAHPDLDDEPAEQFATVFRDAERDTESDIVVLTEAGKAFTADGDVGRMQQAIGDPRCFGMRAGSVIAPLQKSSLCPRPQSRRITQHQRETRRPKPHPRGRPANAAGPRKGTAASRSLVCRTPVYRKTVLSDDAQKNAPLEHSDSDHRRQRPV